MRFSICALALVAESEAYRMMSRAVGLPFTATPAVHTVPTALQPSFRCRTAAMEMATEISMPSSHATGAGDNRPKKIFVLGGDGFCGFPTALHLSDKGHEVIIIDNLSRRKIDVELGAQVTVLFP